MSFQNFLSINYARRHKVTDQNSVGGLCVWTDKPTKLIKRQSSKLLEVVVVRILDILPQKMDFLRITHEQPITTCDISSDSTSSDFRIIKINSFLKCFTRYFPL